MNQIQEQVKTAFSELLAVAKPQRGDLVVVGCSSSEVAGGIIGKNSSADAAKAVYEALQPLLDEAGLFLAVQCCEHLNRALIVEREYALSHGLELVNVVPHAHAGGAFATYAYHAMKAPCAVMSVKAQLGLDVGQTLIGMHLARVAVPVRTSVKQIGGALLTCARTRLPFVGGERARYDSDLM
ncbi:MAG: TIGR01440 family protein [Clostridia bacterium]|nr:TIGR01440 family protein [Clostridia bacterium]